MSSWDLLSQLDRGDSLAVVADGRSWTVHDIRNLAERLLDELSAVPSGRPVGLVMEQSGECVAALLATMALEKPALLVSPALRAEEIETAIRNVGSAVLLSRASGRWGPPRDAPWTLRPSTSHGFDWYDVRHDQAWEAGVPELPTDSCLIQLTSGSAGASQLAVRTRDAVRVEIGAVWDRLDLVDADSVLCVSSIAHSYGLVGGLLTPLARGIPVCLAGDVPSVKECLARGPTIVFGLGPLYQALVDSGDPYELRDAFRSVRLSLSAGAPLPPGLFDRFAACTGLPIRQDYGTTETGTIAIQTEDVPNPEKVGVPLSHIEVRLGTQSGESDGPDRRGEVQVRSMAVAAGYVTGGVLIPCTDEEGWYHTRDRASTGGGGELCLVGRLREPIVTVGGVVQPERVESVIRSKPGVREVVVLATRERPNRVMAVVEASDLLHREALLAWCRSHLARHEVPAELDLRSELPRSPAGKVLQKYLV